MAKTKREFILGAALLSGIATVINLVALGTEQWVVSDLSLSKNYSDFHIKYGLFSGFIYITYPRPTTLELHMTCLMEHNICALMYGNQGQRLEALKNIYSGSNNDSSICQAEDSLSLSFLLKKQILTDTQIKKGYINAAVMITTTLFLVISALFGLIASGLSIWNITTSPIQTYLNILGLYFYNGIACFASLVTLIIWGSGFGSSIKNSAACCWTLTLPISVDSGLGYSYWLILTTIFFYCGSIVVLYVREYLLNKEPKVNVHIQGETDPGLYLY